ncbi:Membrane protein involved in the export of O-antigen and teichoic acid [Zhouia amylolytica]|uniref:Membrane protein involved in the export of O-antigen and teichoic acid n=1 Tax=Zhouia amylolytica TaxID=376730 RepID=A0A1I6PP26_9FLAO|nr:polysaccharide biosynthesis C-terminal domain-containing protein [Zhouia amylolytica]MCQ0112380.1 polysaccharide biosynthesis C-terminal domain-containing protein [Zhouia amylolytica]SFS41944.1 Membrane protein involved in the export of O-antigen and teichoic acid [Zhouia amylolytica]
MSALKKLFKHTFIYGIATVLPRILGLILTPLYISFLPKADYGIYVSLMVYLILGNVLLSYGMETAFFRFINKEKKPEEVQSTALISILISTILVLAVSLLLRNQIADWLEYKIEFIVYAIFILCLDALVVIPFAWYRNMQMPKKYSAIKIFNVIVNLSLNLFFFLILPKIGKSNELVQALTFDDKVHYIFISNLIASLITLVIVLPLYIKIGIKFNRSIWMRMIQYGFPVLIAGLAFSINEGFDKLLLRYLLPSNTSDAVVGVYGACYKLGVFMTLFVTAFKLGVEPFFFQNASKKDAQRIYASITLYFTIFGAFIFLFVVAYTDVLKYLLIPQSEYWEALWIVPLILLANFCLGIYHNLSVWYKITDRTKYGAYISVAGAVITLGLNFLLIPIISYKGSAIATLAAYGTMMLLSYYYGKKHYPIPYNLKKIGSYLLVSIVLSVLSFYVFDRNLYVGTLFVLLFLLMIFILEKNELKKILKRA